MPHVTQHFTIQTRSMSIGKHKDILHSQDCILLCTADVDLWSNFMDWGRLNFTVHTPLLTAHHAGMGTALSTYVLSCQLSTSSSAGTGRMLSGQSTNETTWAVSDVTVVTVTRNRSSCCNVICVYWTAQQRPVTDRPSIQGPSGDTKWLSWR